MGSIWYQPIWRFNKSVDPRGSDTNSGQTNYDDLFADPVAWMENCWIDYPSTTILGIDHKTASYAKLIKWWLKIQQIRPFTLETEVNQYRFR
jgi:uncharacterized lipoprotein YddW (UPF0748 family)